jgi:hypothetical protein
MLGILHLPMAAPRRDVHLPTGSPSPTKPVTLRDAEDNLQQAPRTLKDILKKQSFSHIDFGEKLHLQKSPKEKYALEEAR